MEYYRITYKKQRLQQETTIEAISILSAIAEFYESYGFQCILAIELV